MRKGAFLASSRLPPRAFQPASCGYKPNQVANRGAPHAPYDLGGTHGKRHYHI